MLDIEFVLSISGLVFEFVLLLLSEYRLSVIESVCCNKSSSFMFETVCDVDVSSSDVVVFFLCLFLYSLEFLVCKQVRFIGWR